MTQKGNDNELIKYAKNAINKAKILNNKRLGSIGCALITDKNNYYVGVNIRADCGIGFCAEHSAIANMVTNGENRIKKIVTLDYTGTILPPCGRCRELIYQVNKENINTQVLIDEKKKVILEDLLPEIWQYKFYRSDRDR